MTANGLKTKKDGTVDKRSLPKTRKTTQPIADEGMPRPELGGDVDNGAEDLINSGKAYEVQITLKGDVDLLFHNYNCAAVEEKSKAKKGSEAKKSDDLESYVYRDKAGNLGFPVLNFIAALSHAGRSYPDPRSPRKSARDLLKAILVPGSELITPFLNPASGRPIGKAWDYVDKRRVVVQRSAVTRQRPALREGWEICFHIRVMAGDHVQPRLLRELVRDAGMFSGLGDFRPTFGRFSCIGFKLIDRK